MDFGLANSQGHCAYIILEYQSVGFDCHCRAGEMVTMTLYSDGYSYSR